MKFKTPFTLALITLVVLNISSCSIITGEEDTTEEPLTYIITEGSCGQVFFQESIGIDSTSAVATIRQRKVEEFDHNNFNIKSEYLQVEEKDGSIPEAEFYTLNILDEEKKYLQSIPEVISSKGDLFNFKGCED